MAPIEFWFSIGSTYTYLSVMRLDEVARENGVEFDWRPFSVRDIMVEMDNIPFQNKPAKEAYMWRDIERRAAWRGLEPRLPAEYPLKRLGFANRVAVVAHDEGWVRDYVIAAYKGWFERSEPAGEEPNLSAAIRAAGQDPERVIAAAAEPEAKAALQAATDEARERGVFGSPSFVARGELFWGDDRLEDAVRWNLRGA